MATASNPTPGTANAPEFNTNLTRAANAFMPLIEKQISGNGITLDQYSKQCLINAIGAMNKVLMDKGINWNNPQLDTNVVSQILLNIATLQLNAAASPREVYFQLRNKSVEVQGEGGKKEKAWLKQIEMGIEGDGNDAILARFGRDVKKVFQFWLVRENDVFEYPQFEGVDIKPPVWKPTGKGDVIRIVYPILKSDDSLEYYIGERDDVAKNLIAHINNNMMNETFGICNSRYDATADQLKQIAARKKELLKKAKDLGLDSLDEPELEPWISPAWTEYHSREQMIIRKMRNNIVKKIPKDFGNAFIEMTYEGATSDAARDTYAEIAENANQQPLDVDLEPDNDTPVDGSQSKVDTADAADTTNISVDEDGVVTDGTAEATAKEPDFA